MITHFLIQKSMTFQLFVEEILVFCIGVGMAILFNLHLHRKSAEFEQLADAVDDVIKEILESIALQLMEQKVVDEKELFEKLKKALLAAENCAVANYNNALRKRDTYELDYVRMREQQKVVLQEICRNIVQLEFFPGQAVQVGKIVRTIQMDYHKTNTVEGLLTQLETVLADMKQEKLPVSREEFEARAILFYILLQLKNLLWIKREFIESRNAMHA